MGCCNNGCGGGSCLWIIILPPAFTDLSTFLKARVRNQFVNKRKKTDTFQHLSLSFGRDCLHASYDHVFRRAIYVCTELQYMELVRRDSMGL